MKHALYGVSLASALAVSSILAAPQPAAAGDDGQMFRVTVTNATHGIPFAGPPVLGQVVTPSVIITHNGDFSLFELGAAAGAGLTLVVEEGDSSTLLGELAVDPSVHAAAVVFNEDNVGMGLPPVLFPGQSASVEIMAEGDAKYFTATAMLAVTNDAFYAVRGIRLPKGVGDSVRVHADAYDAGSEVNSESCAFIPGPPCNSAGARDTAGAEGFVHVHSGIHGIGNLDPETHDWRNPVAEITVERID